MAQEAETVRLEAPLEEVLPRKAKRSYTNVPAPIKPDPEAQERGRAAAAAIIAKRQSERAEANKTVAFTGVSYLECTDADCLGPGIWIFGNPEGVLTDDKWESSYKPRGAAWPGAKPFCQCCKARGVERSLRVFLIYGGTKDEPVVTGMIPNARFVRRLPREEYEELVSQGRK